ncbi:LicD family protein [Seongchinamella unica]|uniref:LicD family protein n=1 Tax=Seongchinamella unica TaxID=2547392 RepID=UPI001404CCBC|nr:LicD family protein [Seongchinamella unica]
MKTDAVKRAILGRKSAYLSFFLIPFLQIVLVLLRAPKLVRKDVNSLLGKRRTFQALECVLWFINHSRYRFGEMGTQFDIGGVLGSQGKEATLAWIEEFCHDEHLKWTATQKLSLAGVCALGSTDPWKTTLECTPDSLGIVKNCATRERKIRQHNHCSLDGKDALLALKDLLRLTDRASIPWFMVSGTFLGAVREKNFIGHDYDIDVGIMESEFNLSEFIRCIDASENFHIKGVEYFLNWAKDGSHESELEPAKPAVVKLLHRSSVTIDLFVHYQEREKYVHGTGSHVWSNSPFSIAPYDFLGMQVPGPQNFDLYLTENYGDWRQPKKSFDCDFDTPNLNWASSPYTELYLRNHFDTSGPS